MAKEKEDYTFEDMVRAFNEWRDMNRSATAIKHTEVKQAWEKYTLIRDAINYKPFPNAPIIARPRKRYRNQGLH